MSTPKKCPFCGLSFPSNLYRRHLSGARTVNGTRVCLRQEENPRYKASLTKREFKAQYIDEAIPAGYTLAIGRGAYAR